MNETSTDIGVAEACVWLGAAVTHSDNAMVASVCPVHVLLVAHAAPNDELGVVSVVPHQREKGRRRTVYVQNEVHPVRPLSLEYGV